MIFSIVKDLIDFGIVVCDFEVVLVFYCDIFGLLYQMKFDMFGGMMMYWFFVGGLVVKIVSFENVFEVSFFLGGFNGVIGMCYFMIMVFNFEVMMMVVLDVGYNVVVLL